MCRFLVYIRPLVDDNSIHMSYSQSLCIMFLQVSALLDKELRDIFVDDIKEEYEDVRHDYNESLQVCTCFLLRIYGPILWSSDSVTYARNLQLAVSTTDFISL